VAGTTGPYTEIDYRADDRVATITLSRPDQLNAFTQVMRDELIDAFDRADADDDVRAVVVTGRGRAFCAGADLSRGGDTFNADRLDSKGIYLLGQGPDVAEGVTAFLEKRQARFPMRVSADLPDLGPRWPERPG
jgi:enoyl-CoA hydratase/carnithine racemase